MMIPDNESTRWHAKCERQLLAADGTQLQGKRISANSQCTPSCRRLFPTHFNSFRLKKSIG
jgi:hypothetical protein